MSFAIEIKNLKLRYVNKIIFDDLDLNLEKGKTYVLSGANGSGKTTLVRTIAGLIDFKGMIKVDSTLLVKEEMRSIRKRMAVVLLNSHENITHETPFELLSSKLLNNGFIKDEVNEKVEEVLERFELSYIKDKDIMGLNLEEKVMVSFLAAIITNPSVLIIDDIFIFLTEKNNEKIISFLNTLKLSGMTSILVTNNNDLFSKVDELIVLSDGKVLKKGSVLEVFEKEEVINRVGVEAPFMLSLSYRLKFYGLLERLTLDMEEIVEEVWK